jgi:hypothetical protein
MTGPRFHRLIVLIFLLSTQAFNSLNAQNTANPQDVEDAWEKIDNPFVREYEINLDQSQVEPSEAGGRLFWDVVLIVSIVLLVLAIGYMVFMSFREGSRAQLNERSLNQDSSEEEIIQIMRNTNSKKLSDKARLHADKGRFVDAIMCLHFASIKLLEEQGKISRSKWETNRELASSLPGDLSEGFLELAVLSESLVFGHMPGNLSDYEQAEVYFQRIRGLIR